MFSKNTNIVHNEILNNIPDTYQKTVGYPIYDISRAVAIAVSGLTTDLDTVYNFQDVENKSGDDLTLFVLQRKNIIRKLATYAATNLTITGENFIIKKGDLFSTNGNILFASTVDYTGNSTIIPVQSLTLGSVNNVIANTIINMPVTIAGITSITNLTDVTNGYDEESDSELRQRYYDAIQEPAISGNVYHYKQWAKSIIGVGDCKVNPLANGDGTVEVVLINQNKQPASDDLVLEVQNYIDPSSSGQGNGQAPIGAYCYVVSATALNINVSVTLTLVSGYILANVKTNIENKITEYLKSVAFQQNFISLAKIGNAILDSEGVLDYSSLLINGLASNLAIGEKQVAILGTVTVT